MDIKSFLDIAKQEGNISAVSYSPLNLAYIGDAVFTLLTRSGIVSSGDSHVNKMNKTAKKYVKASAQAEFYRRILEKLTEDELSIIKRGRNAKSFSRAKNASMSDYRHATGLEALFGYLYLKGNNERIIELFDICWKNEVQDEKQ